MNSAVGKAFDGERVPGVDAEPPFFDTVFIPTAPPRVVSDP